MQTCLIYLCPLPSLLYFKLISYLLYAGIGFGMLSQLPIMHILLLSMFVGGSNHVLHVTDFTTLDR
jgi:hypothetical protein